MIHIDKETYKISSSNRYKTKTTKTQIVIGNSLRKKNYHINRLIHKEYGKTKKWNTYTITREGKIFQHYNPEYYSDFLGIKEADKKSISILLENMGALVKHNNVYLNWLNETCEPELTIKKKFMGQYYWENITKEQYESLKFLVDFLMKEFKIENKIIDFHHHHKDVLKFKGIVLRSNYIEDSTDINPTLDISKIKELLQLNSS